MDKKGAFSHEAAAYLHGLTTKVPDNFFNDVINLLKLSKYAVELDMEDELRQYTEVML